MRTGLRYVIAALAVAALTQVAAGAAADGGGLTISISSPRIEGHTLTFTTSGVAAGPIDGESTDYLAGGIVPMTRTCPASGADIGGFIAGAKVMLNSAFPIGAFTVSRTIVPNGPNAQPLAGGDYRLCEYLQDRDSNAVVTAAEQDFTARRAHATDRIVSVPQHIRFYYDLEGRPNARVTFHVRASSEVGLRDLVIGVENPGESCTKAPANPRHGQSVLRRIATGPARDYRVTMLVIWPAGRAPYGKTAEACADVIFDGDDVGKLLEGQSHRTFTIRR